MGFCHNKTSHNSTELSVSLIYSFLTKHPDPFDYLDLVCCCCCVPRTRAEQGEAAFSYDAPRLWNKLSKDLRTAQTASAFKSGMERGLVHCSVFVDSNSTYFSFFSIFYFVALYFITVFNLDILLELLAASS